MAPRRRRHPAKPEDAVAPERPIGFDDPAELRRRAEARLGERRRDDASEARTQQLFHELEVHQIELEMQNAELFRARNELEAALESYTDLYDFAPVGYFTVDESGAILEANLTGAALIGIERSRLLRRRLPLFVPAASRESFLDFLKRIFAGSEMQDCQVLLQKAGGETFWASFRGTPAPNRKGTQRCCRLAFGDVTARKQAEDGQRRLEILTVSNRGLQREIARRKTVEHTLQKSEQEQRRLLEQSHHMQAQLRRLSHQVLHAQEEERKRVSRELHDAIGQTLVSINVRLATLAKDAEGKHKGLSQKIARTQRLVEQAVDAVHQFARELRPTMLDDLGLVPALQSLVKGFAKETGVHVRFKSFTAGKIPLLNNATRTAFYRVAQEALTNVARHAKAGVVELRLEKLPKALCLTVKDDGKSFQAARVMGSKRNTRLGLIGMRERLEMVGGRFDIESARGEGTTIRAEIPFGKAVRARPTRG